MANNLSNRLKTISNLIKKSDFLIDIGADHAYLSIFLVSKKIINHALNIDINDKPVLNGIKNINRYNLGSKIDYIKNDGLKNISINKKIDYINISGVGSNLIIDIIENNKNKVDYYTLCPNNNVTKLREFIFKNGWKILNENICIDNEIYYICLLVSTNFENIMYDDFDIYIGVKLKNNTSELVYNYFNHRLNYLETLPDNKISLNLKKEKETIKIWLKK